MNHVANKNILVRVPIRLYGKLKDVATEKEKTISDMVRDAIRLLVEQESKPVVTENIHE